MPDLISGIAGHSPGLATSVYIHMPWCVRKCPYCDFSSFAAGRKLPMEKEYISALRRDIELFAPVLGEVRTVYFGGGTPSLFSPESISEVLKAISSAAGFAPDAEISLELNPGTGSEEKIRGFREAGITRLSIGVQSFSDMELRRLGRIHSAAEAEETVRLALGAGFNVVNADLMQGLPGQTAGLASADVRKAVSLGVQHISWYQLTLEEGTPMAENPPLLPDEDTLDRINAEGAEILKDAGFRHYEISGFARPGFECRHNLNYWHFGDYIGIGAGGHGKITDRQSRRIFRWGMPENPPEYMKRSGLAPDFEEIGKDQLPFQYFLNTSRLDTDMSLADFEEKTFLPRETVSRETAWGRDRGVLESSGDSLRLTPFGRRYLNSWLEEFLP